jgi:hypothetical protein
MDQSEGKAVRKGIYRAIDAAAAEAALAASMMVSVAEINRQSIRVGDAPGARSSRSTPSPARRAGRLTALRLTFLHKRFLCCQQRLLRELSEAGSSAVIWALRLVQRPRLSRARSGRRRCRAQRSGSSIGLGSSIGSQSEQFASSSRARRSSLSLPSFFDGLFGGLPGTHRVTMTASGSCR